MMTVKPNGVRVLTPDNLPWLTDGTVFSDRVLLGRDADPGEWREASQEEYEAAAGAEEQ